MEKIIKYRALLALIGFVIIAAGVISVSKISDRINLNHNINALNRIMDYDLPDGYEFRAADGIKTDYFDEILTGEFSYGEITICNKNRNEEGYIRITIDNYYDEISEYKDSNHYENNDNYYTFELDGETAYSCVENKNYIIGDEVHFTHGTYVFYIYWQSGLSMSDRDREIFHEFIDGITFK